MIDEDVISSRPKNLGSFCSNYEKPNTRSARRIEENIKNNITKLINCKIPSSAHVREAISHSSTLQFDRKHKVCLAYNALSKYVYREIKDK